MQEKESSDPGIARYAFEALGAPFVATVIPGVESGGTERRARLVLGADLGPLPFSIQNPGARRAIHALVTASHGQNLPARVSIDAASHIVIETDAVVDGMGDEHDLITRLTRLVARARPQIMQIAAIIDEKTQAA